VNEPPFNADACRVKASTTRFFQKTAFNLNVCFGCGVIESGSKGPHLLKPIRQAVHNNGPLTRGGWPILFGDSERRKLVFQFVESPCAVQPGEADFGENDGVNAALKQPTDSGLNMASDR